MRSAAGLGTSPVETINQIIAHTLEDEEDGRTAVNALGQVARRFVKPARLALLPRVAIATDVAGEALVAILRSDGELGNRLQELTVSIAYDDGGLHGQLLAAIVRAAPSVRKLRIEFDASHRLSAVASLPSALRGARVTELDLRFAAQLDDYHVPHSLLTAVAHSVVCVRVDAAGGVRDELWQPTAGAVYRWRVTFPALKVVDALVLGGTFVASIVMHGPSVDHVVVDTTVLFVRALSTERAAELLSVVDYAPGTGTPCTPLSPVQARHLRKVERMTIDASRFTDPAHYAVVAPTIRTLTLASDNPNEDPNGNGTNAFKAWLADPEHSPRLELVIFFPYRRSSPAIDVIVAACAARGVKYEDGSTIV